MMDTNIVAKTGNPDFVDNRVHKMAIEDERQEGGSVYPEAFYHGETPLVDTLGRTPKPAENRHSYPLSTFFSLKLKKEEREKERGSLRESFGPKVDVDETVDADLSTTDLTITAPAIAAFWTDSATHDRQAMRARWVEGRYPDMPRELTGAIVDGAEALRLGHGFDLMGVK